MLTKEDRKEPLEHMCNRVIFKSCLDLSDGVIVEPIGSLTKQVSVECYSQDLATFMCFWEREVMKDLNGFQGFSHVKFILEGFELVDTNKEKVQ